MRPFSLRPTLAMERVGWLGVDRSDGHRRVVGLVAEARIPWRPAEHWGFDARVNANLQEGRTLAQDWNLQRGGLRVQLLPPAAFPALLLEAEAGRLSGEPASPLDRFHLGGLETSLVPASLDAGRIVQAALPDYLQSGDRFQRGRVSLGRAFRGYWEALVVWDRARPKPATQRVAGLEFVLDELMQGDLFTPLLGRMKFTAGVHRILQDAAGGEKLKDKLVATISVVVRP